MPPADRGPDGHSRPAGGGARRRPLTLGLLPSAENPVGAVPALSLPPELTPKGSVSTAKPGRTHSRGGSDLLPPLRGGRPRACGMGGVGPSRPGTVGQFVQLSHEDGTSSFPFRRSKSSSPLSLCHCFIPQSAQNPGRGSGFPWKSKQAAAPEGPQETTVCLPEEPRKRDVSGLAVLALGRPEGQPSDSCDKTGLGRQCPARWGRCGQLSRSRPRTALPRAQQGSEGTGRTC